MEIEDAIKLIDAASQMRPSSLDESQLAEAIVLIADYYHLTRQALSMRGVDGAPDWHGYETALWKLSEKLRPVISKRKSWRGQSEILISISKIVSDSRLRKGRQNFVLLLGDFGGSDFEDQLGGLISDPDISGHVLKALNKMRSEKFRRAVAAVKPALQGWAKREAEHYEKRTLSNPE